MDDLEIVYYTANVIPQHFAASTQKVLLEAIGDLPITIVSQKPTSFGKNTANIILPNLERSHLNIYRQALEGAKAGNTRYIALVEDDVLYSSEHFKYRPKDGIFGYNMSVWSIYTWIKPAMFTWKDRRNLSQLICERDLFIEAMEERFTKYPDDSKVDIDLWAEPGKYERQLGVTQRETEEFYTEPPNIAFSHETALSFLKLGKRKRLGHLRSLVIPQWGSAEEILKLYG